MNSPARTLILSTRNLHKVQEIRALLGNAFDYLTLENFPNAPKVKEDAPTFAGNAIKKAVELADWLASNGGLKRFKRPNEKEVRAQVLADDSGLEVDALDGAPGVHSARFAAIDECRQGNSTDQANNSKLLRLLADVPWEKRTGRFRCAIAVARIRFSIHPDGRPAAELSKSKGAVEVFEGTCEGRIGFAPKGNGGFGYDPLFFPEGFEGTFAELKSEMKNQISHRAKALAKLRDSLLAEE